MMRGTRTGIECRGKGGAGRCRFGRREKGDRKPKKWSTTKLVIEIDFLWERRTERLAQIVEQYSHQKKKRIAAPEKDDQPSRKGSCDGEDPGWPW